MKKYIFTILLMVLLVGVANAQYGRRVLNHYYTLSYSVGLPASSFGDHISTVSLNGGAIQAQYFIWQDLAVGASFGWNTYYQEIEDAYTPSAGVMVSATNYRYVNATPLKAFAQYFFLRKSDLQPYAGLGIGAMYVTAHTRIATLDAWYSQWGLLIAPEVGLLYRLSNRFGVNVAVAYHISSNSFDIGQTAIQSLQSAMLNIGVSCLL